WWLCEPALHSITTFCSQQLGWDIVTGILKHFHANLWDGVCFCMLCMVHQFCFKYLSRIEVNLSTSLGSLLPTILPTILLLIQNAENL
ncbi:hypothetical protein L208DRAFT_1334380, partial [Tricholoma matsutake]